MSSPKLKEVSVKLPSTRLARPDEPWHHYLTIDLVWYVLGYTLFHPWVSWILVLCLRAQYTKYEAPEMRIAMAWAMLMSGIGIFQIASERIAFGVPREVDLSEEVIVITGGVEGLGGLIAETYGMRNANVAVLDIKEVDEEEAEEKGVLYYKCDVGDPKQVEAAIAEIVEDLGPPTILINNAAIVHPKSILESTTEEIEQTFRTNTLSHFTLLRLLLPHMLASPTGGTIVTLSSSLASLGAANLAAYSASKAALTTLHHTLTAELAQLARSAGSPGAPPNAENAKNVKTILVTPGQMSTKLFDGVKTPSRFLAPVVSPAEVGKEILRMVEKGEGGEISLPLYARYLGWMGVLPFGMRQVLRRWSGVDEAVGKAGLVGKK